MRQTALVRLDGVGERDRLGALRALHLYVAPHFRKSGGPPAASARRDYAYSVLNTTPASGIPGSGSTAYCARCSTHAGARRTARTLLPSSTWLLGEHAGS